MQHRQEEIRDRAVAGLAGQMTAGKLRVYRSAAGAAAENPADLSAVYQVTAVYSPTDPTKAVKTSQVRV